jgi:hypothetical protein
MQLCRLNPTFSIARHPLINVEILIKLDIILMRHDTSPGRHACPSASICLVSGISSRLNLSEFKKALELSTRTNHRITRLLRGLTEKCWGKDFDSTYHFEGMTDSSPLGMGAQKQFCRGWVAIQTYRFEGMAISSAFSQS